LRGDGTPGTVRAMPATEPPSAGPPLWRPAPDALPDGVWFGLTTRAGGVSRGPFAGLNLGLGVGDDENAVLENRRRLRERLGLAEEEPRLLHQIHGSAIVESSGAGSRADGFLVRTTDPWVAVSAADCAPVAVVSEDGSRGALLHSGWRGAKERIAAHAVARLGNLGAPPASLRAVIGPCLHACCFPVGADVAGEFPVALLRPHPTGQLALDLPGAIAAALVEAGMSDDRVQVAPECTSCAADRFYSHRRDRGFTGRHWALLRLDPSPSR
jgi:hypothetical protein